MSRRNTEMFNLSFLDLLSGALGAVIFLFIITPKGGEAPAAKPQVVISIDTLHQQVFGTLHDSLAIKNIGDTLLVVIKDFQKMPSIEDCPECPPPIECPDCPKCPQQPIASKINIDGKPSQQKANEIPKRNENVKPIQVVNNAFTKNTESLPTENNESKYKGDPPSVPCLVSFEVSWEDIEDNVDFFVCKGNDCVYGGRKKNTNIGYWDSGKSKNRIFGSDLRTTMEAVRQFDKIIPGEYEVKAQFKESKKGNKTVAIKGLIYSKGKNGKENGERFSRTLTLDKKKKTLLGKVNLKADGSFTFSK